MKTNSYELFEQIRTAYADAGDQRELERFNHDDRCLSFLSGGWFSDEDQAAEAVSLIGPYNAFNPRSVGEMFISIKRRDPSARFAIGRESSPVVYVETEDAPSVKHVFANAEGQPDELATVDLENVGPHQILDPDRDTHSLCRHDEPPVPDDEIAPVSMDKQYVRAWWD